MLVQYVALMVLLGGAAAALPPQELWPGETWPSAAPETLGLDTDLLSQARAYAERGGGAGLVVYESRVVMRWGEASRRYPLKSTTKSIGIIALGLALEDGKVTLDMPAAALHPHFGRPPAENEATGWLPQVTLYHLATHTAGFAKPGGYEPLLFAPGSEWAYSDGGANWLAECLTLAYGQDLRGLLFERVFEPLGIGAEDLEWRDNVYRPTAINGVPRREFGSGIRANADALARIALLFLRGGRWHDAQLLPSGFVEQVGRTPGTLQGLSVRDEPRYPGASGHYGLLWWNNSDGTLEDVPRDTFWAWGLRDSLIGVIPSLDLVAVRVGGNLQEGWSADYAVLAPFLGPIARAVAAASARDQVADAAWEVHWAPLETIASAAEGSDNWPLTWADDGALYTAYGDGWGFEPKLPVKLSLGVAKIAGGPDAFEGVNIRSDSGEGHGDGSLGKKASGMLMVNGVLYMWARNVDNAQLAWSADRARSWEWAEWRLDESFGCPAFLQYGQNYAGAQDEFVYIYSHDSGSAYEPADRIVLARVPNDRMRERGAYHFFAGLDEAERPRWSADVSERRPVFENPGRCYRTRASYNAGLQRYLLVVKHDGSYDPGFSIHIGKTPWGPWLPLYETEEWDTLPGESLSLPPKWMSENGRTMHLVFSGGDRFNVRRLDLSEAESTREGSLN